MTNRKEEHKEASFYLYRVLIYSTEGNGVWTK